MVAASVRLSPGLLFAILAGGLAVAGSGCIVVRAHERGNLAKRAMTEDRDPGEARARGGAHRAEVFEHRPLVVCT